MRRKNKGNTNYAGAALLLAFDFAATLVVAAATIIFV